MKTKNANSENTKRAMSQLFKGGRVIVASEDAVHVISPKALAKTDKNKRLIGGPVKILIDEDITPYDLCVALEALTVFLECDLPSEDVWPPADVILS